MRWLIEGAGASTGHEVRITVEAITQAEAEAHARYNGILVARVTRDLPPESPRLEYASPNVQTGPIAPDAPAEAAAHAEPPHQPLSYLTPETAASGAPGYRDIILAARQLNSLATVITIVGWLCIAGGGLSLLNSMASGELRLPRLAPFWPAVLTGLACLVVSAFMRTAAALSLALRDMARNSFRQTTGAGL